MLFRSNMDLSFYKKEVASLQALFEKFNNIQFTYDQNEAKISKKQNKMRLNEMETDRLSKGGLIIGVSLILLVIGMVAFLTIWLLN